MQIQLVLRSKGFWNRTDVHSWYRERGEEGEEMEGSRRWKYDGATRFGLAAALLTLDRQDPLKARNINSGKTQNATTIRCQIFFYSPKLF